jgi:hypothetical protein
MNKVFQMFKIRYLLGGISLAMGLLLIGIGLWAGYCYFFNKEMFYGPGLIAPLISPIWIIWGVNAVSGEEKGVKREWR